MNSMFLQLYNSIIYNKENDYVHFLAFSGGKFPKIAQIH